MLQDLPLIVGRPFLGGGFGAFFGELEIDPDEVSKEQSEEDRPDYGPEKIIMAWRIPVDNLVLHVPSFNSLDAGLIEIACDQPSIRRLQSNSYANVL
jgi:hypothetical protein